jgi:hypothetical protein
MRSYFANCAQEVRSSVRTVGTHSGAYRQQVRTEVRTLLREAGANLSGGYLEKLPIRMVAKLKVSTVVSTVLQCFSLTTANFTQCNRHSR